MVNTCLFLSICILVLVEVSADWRHAKNSHEFKRPHHYQSDRTTQDLNPVWVPHPNRHLITSTTRDEFIQHDRREADEQFKFALLIAGTVGGGLVLILAIVIVALIIRNKRRRREKIVEKLSTPITNPGYQISIINPKLRGPPPAYDNTDIKNGNSRQPDSYDVKNSRFGVKSSEKPPFDDLYTHLNATDVQNVLRNSYKRGDSSDSNIDSNGGSNGDEADNELSDETDVPKMAVKSKRDLEEENQTCPVNSKLCK